MQWQLLFAVLSRTSEAAHALWCSSLAPSAPGSPLAEAWLGGQVVARGGELRGGIHVDNRGAKVPPKPSPEYPEDRVDREPQRKGMVSHAGYLATQGRWMLTQTDPSVAILARGHFGSNWKTFLFSTFIAAHCSTPYLLCCFPVICCTVSILRQVTPLCSPSCVGRPRLAADWQNLPGQLRVRTSRANR